MEKAAGVKRFRACGGQYDVAEAPVAGRIKLVADETIEVALGEIAKVHRFFKVHT